MTCAQAKRAYALRHVHIELMFERNQKRGLFILLRQNTCLYVEELSVCFDALKQTRHLSTTLGRYEIGDRVLFESIM